jgi:hypothetical protein
MICQHLQPLEEAIRAHGIAVTYRGKPWTENCREWVYFDCYIDTQAVRHSFQLPDCVQDHAHRGTHDGQERGFECSLCHDGVMGLYEPREGVAVFRG